MSDWPTNLTVTYADKGMLLGWDSGGKGAMYVVYMSHTEEGRLIPVGITTGWHHCFADLVAGGLYWFRVQVMGDERISSPVLFTRPLPQVQKKVAKKPAKKVAMKSNV